MESMAAQAEKLARRDAEESRMKAEEARANAVTAAHAADNAQQLADESAQESVKAKADRSALEGAIFILLGDSQETAEAPTEVKRSMARRMFLASVKLQEQKSAGNAKSEALLWNSITQLGFAKEGMKAMTDAVAKRRQDNQPSEFVSWALTASNELIELKQFTLAEPLVRECQAACKKANLRSEFVELSMVNLLLGQQKITEAEQLLLQTYKKLSQPSTAESSQQVVDGQGRQLSPRDQLLPLVDRLITHFTSTNKPDEVAKWKEIASSLRSK